jgi:retron-type reverse transcriptase
MNPLLTTLAAKSRLTVADTKKIVETATKRYKVYRIKRRNGGERTIAHPARELKAVQRALIAISKHEFPIHSCVTAYEKGCSIRVNAEAHKNSEWIAKFDIKNFFNSINQEAWIQYLKDIGVDPNWSELSKQVFFWGSREVNIPCLSVGAPSSPFVSNRFMHAYDCQIGDHCQDNGWKYTRYADDITISGLGEVDFSAMQVWMRQVVEGQNLFLLNEEKSRFLTKGVRRSVTGIVVTNDGRLSIGRKRRRNLEARVHQYVVQQAQDDVAKIRGQLAFLKMIDTAAFNRLSERYGAFVRAKEARLF